jgi:hypothetical protein
VKGSGRGLFNILWRRMRHFILVMNNDVEMI